MMRRNSIKIALAIVIILILLAVGFFVLKGITTVLKDSQIGISEKDPMFSDPPEVVTRPPELDREEVQPDHPTLDDYSDSVSSPVDKTVEELIESARQS